MVIFNGWGYQGFDPSLDRASPLGGEIANTRAARARALHAAAALTGPPGRFLGRAWVEWSTGKLARSENLSTPDKSKTKAWLMK